MAATAELSKEEQDLFNAVKNEEEPKKEEVKQEPKQEEKKDDAIEKRRYDEKLQAEVVERGPQRLVSVDALHEARAQNRELREQMKVLQETVSKTDEKMKSFVEQVTKSEVPKFEEDPAGNLRAENQALQKQLQQITTKMEQTDSTITQQQQTQRFAALVQTKEKDFATSNPDYWKAADFVADAWREEFKEAGMPEDKISEALVQKSLAFTYSANQAGKNPAEAIYKTAKRFGFKGETKKAEDQLETIKKGQ